MRVKVGDAWIRVLKDGVVYHYSSSQYADEFGHTPTKPTEGESIFGGRYTNSTFKVSKEGTKWDSLTDDVGYTNTGSFDLNQESHSVTD